MFPVRLHPLDRKSFIMLTSGVEWGRSLLFVFDEVVVQKLPKYMEKAYINTYAYTQLTPLQHSRLLL